MNILISANMNKLEALMEKIVPYVNKFIYATFHWKVHMETNPF
jgi:hypothetical protein